MRKALLIFCFSLTLTSVSGQSLTVNPNPFDKSTLASFTIAINDSVSLSLYDLTGKEIALIRPTSLLQAGSYQDSVFLDNFPAGIYYLSLKVKSGGSKALKLVKQGAVGMNVFSSGDQIQIYPNPALDRLFINCNNSSVWPLRISIINTIGQAISPINNIGLNEQLDLSYLSAGVYYVIVYSGNGQEMFKVIKQ
jgi:hypothetical protein